ncbi:hypothetical protein Syun_029161 [Stephania yunnanensis]|uniref:Phytocyanin domain-containing protein n=1 Tax=Stephania yunnanensis TaxID=152371 RepID=A0AAP0E8F6_9MAGN
MVSEPSKANVGGGSIRVRTIRSLKPGAVIEETRQRSQEISLWRSDLGPKNEIKKKDHLDRKKRGRSGKNYQTEKLKCMFSYSPTHHNRLQVREAFVSCDKAKPLRVFTSGADVIALNDTGHFFFICGLQSHCEIT